MTLDGGRVGSAGLEAKAGQDDWYGDNATKGNPVLKLKEFLEKLKVSPITLSVGKCSKKAWLTYSGLIFERFAQNSISQKCQNLI